MRRSTVSAAAALQFQEHKLVFRRYAHLFFIMCVDQGDNELAVLEAIHLFVEILDTFFTKVTELDIVLNFHKVRRLSVLLRTPAGPFCPHSAYCLVCMNRDRICGAVAAAPSRATRQRGLVRVQAYLILDEFVLAGELQESSKHVILERISLLDMLHLS